MSDQTQDVGDLYDEPAEHTRRERICPRCGEPASRYGGGFCANCATDDMELDRD